MKAILVDTTTSERNLKLQSIPDPECGAGEVLIQVKAAGLNRADLLQRAGKYPPPPGSSEVLGLEVSGLITDIGEKVTAWRKGDKVCALLAGGGYGELVAVPQEQLLPMPNTLSWQEGAGLPEAFITAFLNLVLEGGMKAGDRVLVHGGSSGVGTAAIQIAKSLKCHVACTVGNQEKGRRCSELGAECVVNYKLEDFEPKVRAWTGIEGVDVVLDIVGKDYLGRNISLLAVGGRLVVIATSSGSVGEINLTEMMRKRARVIGSVLRVRPVKEKGAIIAAFRAALWEEIETGSIRPVIDSVYGIADVEKAHERMRSSMHVGKIILEF